MSTPLPAKVIVKTLNEAFAIIENPKSTARLRDTAKRFITSNMLGKVTQ